MYLDDVEEIFSILRGLGGPVVAETEDFADISSAEELRNLGAETIADLTMTGQKDGRTVVVHLGGPTVVRISSRDDNDLVGASQRIGEVLTPREQEFGAFEMQRVLLPAAMALMVLVTMAWLRFIVVTAVPLFLTGRHLVGFSKSVPRATVVLRWRHEVPTFWERHRTSIVISLATNVIVAVAVFFFGEATR